MGFYRATFLASLTASLVAGVAPAALASGAVRSATRTATVAQADPNAPASQPPSGDPGTADPSASDPGSIDPNAADPGAGDPGATDTTPADAPPQPTSPLAPSLPDATPSPIAPKPTRARKHAILATPIRSGHTVAGTVAELLPSGRAAAPADAPYAVKLIIWTANRLIGLPYRYGGGHGAFADNAYDCSGAVSYALHAADAIAYPEDSTLLGKWGLHGTGKWVTVYANRGHAWMIVAGLRLDTSAVDDPAGLDGPRWRPAARSTAGYRVRHPRGL